LAGHAQRGGSRLRRTEGVDDLLDIVVKLRARSQVGDEVLGLLLARDLAGEQVEEHGLGQHLLAVGRAGQHCDFSSFTESAADPAGTRGWSCLRRSEPSRRRCAPQKRMPSLASRTDGSQSMTFRPRMPPKTFSTLIWRRLSAGRRARSTHVAEALVAILGAQLLGVLLPLRDDAGEHLLERLGTASARLVGLGWHQRCSPRAAAGADVPEWTRGERRTAQRPACAAAEDVRNRSGSARSTHADAGDDASGGHGCEKSDGSEERTLRLARRLSRGITCRSASDCVDGH